jgi:integrase
MPRFGKGKPMIEQARGALRPFLSLTSRHDAKQAAGIRGSRSTGLIHSIGTFSKYVRSVARAGEWLKEVFGLRQIQEFKLCPALAQQYLADRAELGIGQKQLDCDRVALEFLIGKGALIRERALTAAVRHCRAYTSAQIALVMSHQSKINATRTEIAWRGGLRAHELLTICRTEDAAASAHRHWRADRFSGRTGARYVVTGKGGLRREVLLPIDLVERLETYRLDAPRTVKDRGIFYEQYYSLGGGNAWSKSFSEASFRALRRSHGAHGLRHTYAQERMLELQNRNIDYYEARSILAQELGHFRSDVVEVYLR